MSEKALVLIVDDSAMNLDILKNILQEDYKVYAAKDGVTALAIAGRQKPDIILLDVVMPEMDGYEVCQWLKSDPITEDIPVIFVTAQDQAMDEARGFELGAVDYITKPVTPLSVKARLNAHIGLRDRQKKLESMVEAKTEELSNMLLDTLGKLGKAAEYKDEDTGRHVIRIGRFAYETAKSMGFSERAATQLLHAAPLHDVGKIGIPDYVLLKPGKLNDEEWHMMQQHTVIGENLLADNGQALMRLAGTIAKMHHEKWDGSGYPSGLEGEEIDIHARIVSVVDVFDALTTRRPYKGPWVYEKALAHIRNESGSHFDPRVVRAFLDQECQEKILEIMAAVPDRFTEKIMSRQ